MTILDAIHDRLLFKPLFKQVDTWRAWLVVLRSVFALPLEGADLLFFRQLTGRETPHFQQVQECWLVVGRRGGKSFIVALIAVFLATFRDYRPFLGPGERGTLMVIATDRKQARVIMRYLTALLNSIPMLAAMIERQDSASIDLNNRVNIEITTASYRTIRGYTVVAALCDEIAFWRSEESANPAEEILSALRPAMSTIPGSMLIALGTPYRRSGPLYESYRRHYAQESPVLVIQADTRTMNPTVPQCVIDQAMEADPAAAQAEYFATFRSDVGSFLESDLIERAIETGRRERAPLAAARYLAFCDPSGGAHDAFTLAIAHRDQKKRVVLDVCRGIQPPFDPSWAVAELALLLKTYRCYSVVGDRYAGEWVREAFGKHGITYRHSEHTKSEIYLESLPSFTTGSVDLLDVQRLKMELLRLERRTSRSGRDVVDHPPNGHDDYSNAACGALVLVAQQGLHTARMVKVIGF